MDASINYLVEDGTNLSKTVDEQSTLLEAEGFDAENNVKLKEALNALELSEKAQNKSVNETSKKSAIQIKTVNRIHSLIKRLRDTVRGGFQDEPKKIRKFKVDEPIPKGMGALCALCEFLVPLVEDEKAVLLKNGFVQADIDELAAAAEKVKNTGSDRKRTLKVQKSSTIVRNESAEIVKKLTRKIRKFAKARFAERPEILVLFEPTSKGRGPGGGDEEKPTENPANPDGTKK